MYVVDILGSRRGGWRVVGSTEQVNTIAAGQVLSIGRKNSQCRPAPFFLIIIVVFFPSLSPAILFLLIWVHRSSGPKSDLLWTEAGRRDSPIEIDFLSVW